MGGGNYYYIRCNWNADVNYGISQTIADLPAGMYKLTYKAATNSSNWAKSQHTVSLSESEGMTSTKTMYSTGASWTDFETYIYKSSATSTLTIKVNMLAGDANSGQHYNLLVDDFKLFYCEDLGASSSSPVDFTGYISNASIYNTNNTFVPRGWTSASRSVGNSNFTEKTGNTQLEAWSGGNMYYDYYQVISGLPNGVYALSAKCHDSNDKGGFLYATAGSTTKTADMPTDYTTITTEKISVSDGSLRIGIKSETTSGGSWMTGDDFVLTFYGYDPTEALAALATQIASATFTEKHSVASETDLQTAITAAQELVTAGTGTKAEIETASANLSAAISAVETSIADYANLKIAIESAQKYYVIDPEYNALIAAVATANGIYDNGTAESCTSTIASLDAAVKAAKVNDYTYVSDNFQYSVTLDEKAWKTTGYVADFSNEHWSGAEHKYKNQDDSNGRGWNSSTGFTIGLNQDVTLPAGKYVFKACGRKSAGATMKLQVKAGETDLGTVTDFPNGSSARGINKVGETSFDEDNDAYANNGNGFGWQWRFVAFELTEETTINVSVSASATVAHEWASFGDYSVLTDNEANIAMIAYNVALNSAKTAVDNETYKNVSGTEKSALQSAIAANMAGKTKTEIESATIVLKEATDAFTAAAPAYDAFVASKLEAETYSVKLPYASATKFAAISTATSAEVTSAEGATSAAAEIRKAYRAYIESNAMAEVVADAEDCTELIENADFADKFNGWTSSQSGGTLGCLDAEPLTTADGSSCKYYDYWNGDSNTQHVSQILTDLPAGKYIFTVAARADVNLNPVYVKIGDQKKAIEKIGATGGAFGRGWNDCTVEYTNPTTQDVTIEVYTTDSPSKKSGWFGFTRARLVRLGDAEDDVTINSYGYASFSATYDVAVPTGVEAYYASEAKETLVKMTKIEDGKIPANTGVILKGEAGKYTLTATTGATAISGNLLVAVTTAINGLPAKDESNNTNYVLKNGQFVTWAEGVTTNVAAGKAYLSVPSSSAALGIDFGDATAINTVNANAVNGTRVNLAGQAVGNGYKGIVIENGKKILVK